jgi:hypothetical protein
MSADRRQDHLDRIGGSGVRIPSTPPCDLSSRFRVVIAPIKGHLPGGRLRRRPLNVDLAAAGLHPAYGAVVMWLPKSSVDPTVVGHRVIAIHPDALRHAVDDLVAVGPTVGHLKIRAGEHLAALLLTAVCGPPISVDTAREVDLLFDRQAPNTRNWCFGDHDRAAVEVKSYAGDYREVESRMQLGDSHTVRVRTALDILSDATVQIGRAVEALERKAAPRTSRNVFLIIHMFDAVAVEAYDELAIMGHRLPEVDASVEVDTLWILWHPGMLTMWSQHDRRWTGVLFAVQHEPAQASEPGDMDALQEAEDALLTAIGHHDGSPWLFGFGTA